MPNLLGIEFKWASSLDARQLKKFKLSGDENGSDEGPRKSLAKQARLKKGDAIRAVNDKPVPPYEALFDALREDGAN